MNRSTYYAKIAFSSARSVLKNKTDEKRNVPVWLVDEFKKLGSYENIVSSLESLEIGYKKRNPQNLIVYTTSLLDSVLNLCDELKKKKNISGKLRCLMAENEFKNKFGVSDDMIKTLDSCRLIRNDKVIHKDKSLKYDIPFMIATSFAYLALFFVETVILNGEIIKIKNDKK